jgi:hypothetical protein
MAYKGEFLRGYVDLPSGSFVEKKGLDRSKWLPYDTSRRIIMRFLSQLLVPEAKIFLSALGMQLNSPSRLTEEQE